MNSSYRSYFEHFYGEHINFGSLLNYLQPSKLYKSSVIFDKVNILNVQLLSLN